MCVTKKAAIFRSLEHWQYSLQRTRVTNVWDENRKALINSILQLVAWNSSKVCTLIHIITMTHKVYVMSSGRQVERVLGLSILWGLHFLQDNHFRSDFSMKLTDSDDSDLSLESGRDNNHCGFPPFRQLTFRRESFWHGCFIMEKLWHVHRLALRTFLQMDISTQEYFTMWRLFFTQNENFFSTQNNFEQILMLWISLVFPKGHMRVIIVLVLLRTQICESSESVNSIEK